MPDMAQAHHISELNIQETHMNYIQCVNHSGGVLYIITGVNSQVSIEYYNHSSEEFVHLCQLNIDISQIMYVVCTQNKITFLCERRILELCFKTLQHSHRQLDYEFPKNAGIVIHRPETLFFGGKGNTSNKILSFHAWDGLRAKRGVMLEEREFPSTASLGKFVYVVGGTYDNSFLNSAERYNPSTGASYRIAGLLRRPRVNRICTAVDGKLYVCSKTKEPSEVYDPESGQWNYVNELQEENIQFLFADDYELHILYGKFLLDEEYSIKTYNPTENYLYRKYLGFRRKERQYSLISALVTNSATRVPEWVVNTYQGESSNVQQQDTGGTDSEE